MNDHSVFTRAVSIPTPSQALLEERLSQHHRSLVAPTTPRRGRRCSLTNVHVCVGLLVALFEHMQSQLDLWRLLSFRAVGGFLPVLVTDQTVYNALARASSTMRWLFEHLSQQARLQLAPWQRGDLAPFATQILALDESTLDKVGRYLPDLRQAATHSTASVLAGRISALFDLRLQQWVRVDILPGATTNCKVHARQMLQGLHAGTLILFDRGYFAFEWFDTLTAQGLFWISRYSNHVSYQIQHICYQGDGVLDAIVTLGNYRADQARHPVRLLRFVYRGQTFCYLTNVHDPHLLPLADVVRLYARRWDIELGFRLLKDFLNFSLIWSAKWPVIEVQLYACLILAQLFHGLQQELAWKEGIDPGEISMQLLVRLLPSVMKTGSSTPIEEVRRFGRDWGLIRPSSRRRMDVPFIDPSWVTAPPEEILKPREKVRHAYRRTKPHPLLS